MTSTDGQAEPAPPEVYAELAACAADDRVFEPSLVTAILGVEPTRAVEAGDALPWGGVRAHGSWSWVLFPKQVAHYADDVVDTALSVLAGGEDAIAVLREQHQVEFHLGLVVEMHVALDEDGEPIARTPTFWTQQRQRCATCRPVARVRHRCLRAVVTLPSLVPTRMCTDGSLADSGEGAAERDACLPFRSGAVGL